MTRGRDSRDRYFGPAGAGVEFADEAETTVVLGEGFFLVPGVDESDCGVDKWGGNKGN